MAVINKLKETWLDAKKVWQTQKVEPKLVQEELGQAVMSKPVMNNYFVDTLSKTSDELPQISNGTPSSKSAIYRGSLDTRLEKISNDMNAELSLEEKNFEHLQAMIYNVIMLMMRLAAKRDQENIYEISLKIKSQTQEIKGTYNTWGGLMITVVSSTVSVAAGCAGLAPFAPAAMLSAQNATLLANASTGIGSAGSGIGGFGSIPNNNNEMNRQLLQHETKRLQDTEEERKSSKHGKNDLLKTARAAAEEFARSRHEANRAAAAA